MSECTVFPGSGGENHIAYAAWAPKSQATHNKLPPTDPGVELLIDFTVPPTTSIKNGNIVVSTGSSLHGSCFMTKRDSTEVIPGTTVGSNVTCTVTYTVNGSDPGVAKIAAGDYNLHYTIDKDENGSGFQPTCDFRLPRT